MSILDVILHAINSGFAGLKALVANEVADVRTAVSVSDAKLDQILSILAVPSDIPDPDQPQIDAATASVVDATTLLKQSADGLQSAVKENQ